MGRRFAVFCFLPVFTLNVLAQTPLAIDGLTDKTTYTDSVSFRVPVTPGYSFAAFVDGDRLPVAVTNVISQVDYHEVAVWRTNVQSGEVTNRTVRLIVQSSSRGNPEKGLIVWTPYPPVPSASSEWTGAQLHVVAPRDYPLGLDVPMVAWVDDGQGRAVRGNGWVTPQGYDASSFRLVRGHGSGFLSAMSTAGTAALEFSLSSLTASNQIDFEPSTSWTSAGGILASDTSWPAGSRIALVGNFTIPSGVTLRIGAGSVVKINSLVNITNSGTLIIEGTLSEPVIFTSITRPAPERNTGAWGGIIMRGGHLIANGAILTGAGGATSFDFSPGSSHRSEQALLLVHSGSTAALTNCFLLNQAGQVMNGYNSDITLDHCLVQRAITAGESVGGTIIVNHSAIIEFPAIDGVYNAAIADADYDAIYFTTGTHVFTDSLVGFSKDDAIDSGSGGAGTVLVTNCWIESALHEALAWSGGGRQTWAYDSVLMNCGQGIEAGWTEGSADHSPDCFAERLLSTANSVGARFGDNYDWTYYGRLRLTNSFLLHNYRDVFAKTWNTSGSSWNTNQWVDRLAQMDLRSNLVSSADVRFSSNTVWNAQTDALKLQSFMSTPAAALVGVGFAVWTNQFAMATVFEGVPVRLSSFTTHPVTVQYSFAGPNGTLGAGSLTFSPGETLKRVFPAGFTLQGQSPLHVVLTGASGGEVTGVSDVSFSGNLAPVTLSLPVPAAQAAMERLGEGVPVQLSGPAAHEISVGYRFIGPGNQLLSGGSLTFAPGETLKWVAARGVTQGQYDLIRFDLIQPAGAELSGITNLIFVSGSPGNVPEPVAFISRGTVWKYLDDGSNQGTGWRDLSFLDQTWASGLAQLGFGDNDEATPISRTNRVTGTTNITFYFRSAFVVTNAASFTNVSLWLLRDDGGVVYLNSHEVFRSTNMPPGQIAYNTLALSTGENSVDTAIISATNLVAGTNMAAVEIHQQALTSSDVSFDFELIGNPAPAASAPQLLYGGMFNGELTLAWGDNAYALEQANTVTGAWFRVSAPSPISVAVTNAQTFYRLSR